MTNATKSVSKLFVDNEDRNVGNQEKSVFSQISTFFLDRLEHRLSPCKSLHIFCTWLQSLRIKNGIIRVFKHLFFVFVDPLRKFRRFSHLFFIWTHFCCIPVPQVMIIITAFCSRWIFIMLQLDIPLMQNLEAASPLQRYVLALFIFLLLNLSNCLFRFGYFL